MPQDEYFLMLFTVSTASSVKPSIIIATLTSSLVSIGRISRGNAYVI